MWHVRMVSRPSTPPFSLSASLAAHRCPFADFRGENCLHLAIVNREERLFLAMLNLADQLPDGDRELLLTAQAAGPFFMNPPMLYYGGTVLAYAACHLVPCSCRRPSPALL